MHKVTFTLAFNLSLLGLACAAEVCPKAHAQGPARGSTIETNNIFSGGISPPAYATIDFGCADGSVFRVSSGDPTGTCTPLGNGSGAKCAIGTTTVALFNCPASCVFASDTGSCTQVR